MWSVWIVLVHAKLGTNDVFNYYRRRSSSNWNRQHLIRTIIRSSLLEIHLTVLLCKSRAVQRLDYAATVGADLVRIVQRDSVLTRPKIRVGIRDPAEVVCSLVLSVLIIQAFLVWLSLSSETTFFLDPPVFMLALVS